MGSDNFFHKASLHERQFCPKLLPTFNISHSLVKTSVVNIGTSSTHWQYSTIIFINISKVLWKNWMLLRFAEKFYSHHYKNMSVNPSIHLINSCQLNGGMEFELLSVVIIYLGVRYDDKENFRGRHNTNIYLVSSLLRFPLLKFNFLVS